MSLFRVSVVLCGLGICVPFAAEAQTKTKFDPARIKREMEQKRREFEQKRKEMERKRGRSSSSFRTRRPSLRPRPLRSSKSASIAKTDSKYPKYKLTPGKEFAYDVSIVWKNKGRTYQLKASPYYQVRYGSESKATALVIGHYRLFVKEGDDQEYRHLSSRDYWLPSIQMFGRRGFDGAGNQAVGRLHTPDLLTEFVSMNSLTTPGLPTTLDQRVGKTEPAVITRTANGPTLWAGFTSNKGAGRLARYTEAKSLGSTVRIDVDRKYENESTNDLAHYKASMDFDRSAGILRSSKGTYELQDKGNTIVAAISVRKLSGTELASAKKSAFADLANMPKSLLPTQLARRPIDLDRPASYTSETLPAEGKTVAFYDRDLKQRFQAVIEKKISDRNVKIRCIGSNEVLTVSPTSLAKLDG